jgi:hypothetical protein
LSPPEKHNVDNNECPGHAAPDFSAHALKTWGQVIKIYSFPRDAPRLSNQGCNPAEPTWAIFQYIDGRCDFLDLIQENNAYCQDMESTFIMNNRCKDVSLTSNQRIVTSPFFIQATSVLIKGTKGMDTG